MKKKKHKEAKLIRWELVHAAGCTEPNCNTKSIERDDYSFLSKPVSVPRTLRFKLGRYIK